MGLTPPVLTNNCSQQTLEKRQTHLLKHCRLNGLLLGLVSRVQQALFHELINGNQQCVAAQSVQAYMAAFIGVK